MRVYVIHAFLRLCILQELVLVTLLKLNLSQDLEVLEGDIVFLLLCFEGQSRARLLLVGLKVARHEVLAVSEPLHEISIKPILLYENPLLMLFTHFS